MEQVAIAMFGYMTDLDTVEVDPRSGTKEIQVEGHDLPSLLYNYLDELLFLFATEDHVCRDVRIVEFERTVGAGDASSGNWQGGQEGGGESEVQGLFKIKALAYGEAFDLKKHPQGTEVLVLPLCFFMIASALIEVAS